MIRRPSPGFSSRYCPDLTLHLGVAELRLCLTLELGLGQLHADDRGQALPNVIARKISIGVLQHAGAPRPIVQRARQRRPEPRDVGPAVDRVDVVRECEDVLGVRVVVLEGDFDGGRSLPLLAVDRAGVEDLLVPVQMPHERDEAALEVERPLSIDPLVEQGDPDALREVRRLSQPL
jgi:hypothetical protein